MACGESLRCRPGRSRRESGHAWPAPDEHLVAALLYLGVHERYTADLEAGLGGRVNKCVNVSGGSLPLLG